MTAGAASGSADRTRKAEWPPEAGAEVKWPHAKEVHSRVERGSMRAFGSSAEEPTATRQRVETRRGEVRRAGEQLILRLVRGQRFYLFAYYLWPLGTLAILWQHLG